MKVFNKNNFMIHSLVPTHTRYAQSNLHITSEFTEVTNGHYLIRVYTRENEDNELPETDNLKPSIEKVDVLISVNSAREIERAIPNSKNAGHMPILKNAWIGKNTNEETIEFICTDLETWKPVIARKVDERYANTEAIMPKEKPGTEICFNPEYMEKLCQQFKKAEIGRIKLSIYGNEKAIKLEGKNTADSQRVVALLMPMKP